MDLFRLKHMKTDTSIINYQLKKVSPLLHEKDKTWKAVSFTLNETFSRFFRYKGGKTTY